MTDIADSADVGGPAASGKRDVNSWSWEMLVLGHRSQVPGSAAENGGRRPGQAGSADSAVAGASDGPSQKQR
ncbi:hypothetical protein [Crateriforma conspicua]|uniref:hypothetical protein n=1 Tax=Crateriforma conspicua TaxID=2527996 RepID=UPI0013FCF5D2|nr:hypothetical protein [Crateriforma conspicua]